MARPLRADNEFFSIDREALTSVGECRDDCGDVVLNWIFVALEICRLCKFDFQIGIGFVTAHGGVQTNCYWSTNAPISFRRDQSPFGRAVTTSSLSVWNDPNCGGGAIRDKHWAGHRYSVFAKDNDIHINWFSVRPVELSFLPSCDIRTTGFMFTEVEMMLDKLVEGMFTTVSPAWSWESSSSASSSNSARSGSA